MPSNPGSQDPEDTIGKILQAIEDVLRSGKTYVERLYAYADAGQIQLIRKYGELLSEEYTENGIFVKAYIPDNML